ncbi:MAG: putative lipoprotein [Desulfocapsa sp.]|uniref:Lipoprotein n=1 Tax=Desulfotalea psychrophila TaxID=84980 RepID=A0ABS3ASX8_9BACT|nr:putative lipoprotein [Desulfocapsa sp.]MBN4060004.1 putative lipoprotein [Desulfotalea psychrophila]MBN4068219.1 putative lipoprotein [Desulfotalea psychrophila]
MFIKKQYKYILSIVCFSLLQAGCSISYSLEKSSDSVSASLDSITSISTSSSGGEDEKVSATSTVYEEDVAAATVLYVGRNKTTDEYQRQVTNIAKNHGISNWEQEQSTFLGMGKGLRRAGVSRDSIANIPYFRSMVADNSTSYSKVIKGYLM